MAEDSLSERGHSFNQLSLSSRAAFQFSERIANLEEAVSLLAKAKALTAVAIPHAFDKCSHAERYYYLAVLNELLEAAAEQIDEALDGLRSETVK